MQYSNSSQTMASLQVARLERMRVVPAGYFLLQQTTGQRMAIPSAELFSQNPLNKKCLL